MGGYTFFFGHWAINKLSRILNVPVWCPIILYNMETEP